MNTQDSAFPLCPRLLLATTGSFVAVATGLPDMF